MEPSREGLPPLTVIVVAFNRLEYTRRTVRSLAATVPKDTRVILFDNCSTEPGFREYAYGEFRQTFPNSKYVWRVSNAGWGQAVNEALVDAKTEHVLVSNNDVEYKPGWYEECLRLYAKYPKIGVLGVWKHIHHGVLEDKGDLIVKDQMPAVGWLLRRQFIDEMGAFPVHGPCATKGGNGEDVAYCIRAAQKGYMVAGPKEDVATHIDGY